MKKLKLQDVSKSYGNNSVMENLNLEVSENEFLVVVGQSGCGKSTFLRLIGGFEKLNNGKITFDGKELNQKDTAMVFQDYALFPNLKVKDNIGFSLIHSNWTKEEKRDAINNIVKALKIDHLINRYPSQLSGGEKQRVAIARSLVRQPQIFLLDEPLSHVDANLKNELLVEIKKLYAKSNALFIYVTHDQVEALKLATKILIMSKGKIVQFGSKNDIINAPSSKYVIDFFSSLNYNILRGKIIAKKSKYYIDYHGILLPLNNREYDYHTLTEYQNANIDFCFKDNQILLNNAGQFPLDITEIEDVGTRKIIHANVFGDNITITHKEGNFKTFDILGKVIIFDSKTEKNIFSS